MELPDSLKQSIEALDGTLCSFEPGDVIVRSAVSNDYVYIIQSGRVEMYMEQEGNRASALVDKFCEGELIGLISFWTRAPSFLEARAATPMTCWRLTRADIDKLSEKTPHIREWLQQKFISSLSDRYRRMVQLNARVAELKDHLELEKAQLNETIEELKKTRNQLIHHEKMATLGQLMAGIAHELNNPCAALYQGAQDLKENLPKLLSGEEIDKKIQLLQSGLDAPFSSAQDKQERLKTLQKTHPATPRSLLRRLSHIKESDLKILDLSEIPHAGSAGHDKLLALLDCYEAGLNQRAIQISAQRIQKLVTSLKNYGRHSQSSWEYLDITEGLRDTLTILRNQLQHYTLELELEPLPELYCIGIELNQVWTNLLINAMQATPRGGTIRVIARATEGEIELHIQDTGKGIPPHLIERIFEPNFTTKTTNSEFGLGLGLAISQEIIAKHNGKIIASNRPEGGAEFVVRLPLAGSA